MRKENIRYALLALSVFIASASVAQNSIFLQEGKIEFEKKLNNYAQLDENSSWSEVDKKLMSKFRITYFDLSFNKNTTLYQPGRDNPDNNKLFFSSNVGDDKVVYAELDSATSISQKKVFEETFLIRDSTRRIQWKITDETRSIAGFNCRRANALIMDTIYVVAFYTDEILANGGPESFNGLPGMILGVSLPHQHVSWFATHVDATPVPLAKLKAPVKGKKVTNAMLKDQLKERMKDWGKYAQQYLEAVML